jgi:hypothetical protein
MAEIIVHLSVEPNPSLPVKTKSKGRYSMKRLRKQQQDVKTIRVVAPATLEKVTGGRVEPAKADPSACCPQVAACCPSVSEK